MQTAPVAAAWQLTPAPGAAVSNCEHQSVQLWTAPVLEIGKADQMNVAMLIPDLGRPSRTAGELDFESGGDVRGGQHLALLRGVTVEEGLQPEPIKDYSLRRRIILYGVMLVVALLLGSVPVFISYRRM